METVSEGQISEPTTAQYRTVPLRPYNVTFDPLSIGLVKKSSYVIFIYYKRLSLAGYNMCLMVISNRSWLLLRSVARSHRCFWVWPLPGFLALMSWCLHYFDYAHFVTNSFDKCINDVMTMTSDLSWMWKHFHCNPDSRKITLFRKVAIGIRRKTPQIIERGEDLVASFDENLRPGRTYQVPHHTHMFNGHCPALFCLVSKSEDDDGDPCNSLTMS